MTQFGLMLVLGLGLIALPQNTFAQEGHEGHEHMDHMAATEAVTEAAPADAANEVGNMICPISGEKVGQMGEIVKIEHNGKMVNLCCAMCKKDFEKDPEAFLKKAEEQAAQEAETN